MPACDGKRCLTTTELSALEEKILGHQGDLVFGAEPPGASIPTVLAVTEGKAGRAGVILEDANRDGMYTEANSGGLKPPAFKSESGRSVVGVSFFSTEFFGFASSTEPGVAAVVLRSGEREVWVGTDVQGVSDISTQWLDLAQAGRAFEVVWHNTRGGVLDSLAGTFPGVVD